MSDLETHNENLKAALERASEAADSGDTDTCAGELAEADKHLESLYEEAGASLQLDALSESEHKDRIVHDGELDSQSAHMMVERTHEKRQELLQRLGRLELL